MSSDEVFLEALAKALQDVGLEAVVVGMTAAALQGVPGMTEDVDLIIRNTDRNRQELEQLCIALGGLAPVQVSELADVLTLVGGPVPIDIVFDRIPGGLEFAGLKSRSVEIAVGSRTIRVAALEDIVRSKKVADRPKDRAQLPILEQSLAVLKKLK